MSTKTGSNRYEIYISFSLFVTLYVRVMQVADSIERRKQLVPLFSILKFLIIPDKCHHFTLEGYFEDPCVDKERSHESYKCGSCSFCNGEHAKRTGKVNKQALTSILIVNMQQQTHYTKFVKQIKEKKDIVYDKDSIPGDAAPIHALCLQLLAKGIVKLNIENKSLIGTSNLEAKHIDVSLSTENVNGYPSLAILNNKNWEGINFYG